MTFDAVLPMMATLFGWEFYNTIWDTLVATGIVYIPFLWTILSTIIESQTEGDFTEAKPAVALNRLVYDISVKFVVILIAAQPSALTAFGNTPIRVEAFPSVIQPSPSTVDVNDTKSTFNNSGFACPPTATTGPGGAACPGVAVVEVPAWWFLTIGWTQGINRSIIGSFPQRTRIRELQQVANLMKITNPTVREEAGRFFGECFIQAKRLYEANPPVSIPEKDVWFGSGPFRGTYYGNLVAEAPVPGFTIEPTGRDEAWADPDNLGAWGRPTCLEWYDGQSAPGDPGLRSRLLAEAKASTDPIVQASLSSSSLSFLDLIRFGIPGTDPVAEDWSIRKLFTNSEVDITDETTFDNRQSSFSIYQLLTIKFDLSAALTNIFVPLANLGATIVTDILVFGAPFVQALLLLSVYALFPFALVVSQFSLSYLGTGAIFIFTISFWSVLWHMVGWIDDQLILVLWPDRGALLDSMLTSFQGDVNGFSKKMILNMAIMSLYLLVPGLFTALMASAGVRAGSALASIQQNAVANGGIGQAANAAGAAAKTVAATAATGGNVKAAASQAIGRLR